VATYNPPFIYSIDTYMGQGERVAVGLGNGSILGFKKKGLSLEEIHADTHRDQICSLKVLEDHKLVITASNDLTIGMHRMSRERLIDKTVLRIGIENKVNDMVIHGSG